MQKIKLESFTLIGISLPEKTNNQNGQSGIDCGNLWQQFEQENYAAKIPRKINEEIVAVYFDYESDHNGDFSYFIGCKVEQGTIPPEGMETLTIPEQHYSKVVAKGKMPDCIANAWLTIWNSDINRAYAFDLEIYGERSKDWSKAEVDIYISEIND